MLLIQSCVDDGGAANLVLDQDNFAKSVNKQILEHLLVIEEPPAGRIEELNADAMEVDEANEQGERARRIELAV